MSDENLIQASSHGYGRQDDDGRRYQSCGIAPTANGLFVASFGLCDHRIEPGDHDTVEAAALAHMQVCPPNQPVLVERRCTRLGQRTCRSGASWP